MEMIKNRFVTFLEKYPCIKVKSLNLFNIQLIFFFSSFLFFIAFWVWIASCEAHLLTDILCKLNSLYVLIIINHWLNRRSDWHWSVDLNCGKWKLYSFFNLIRKFLFMSTLIRRNNSLNIMIMFKSVDKNAQHRLIFIIEMCLNANWIASHPQHCDTYGMCAP